MERQSEMAALIHRSIEHVVRAQRDVAELDIHSVEIGSTLPERGHVPVLEWRCRLDETRHGIEGFAIAVSTDDELRLPVHRSPTELEHQGRVHLAELAVH